MPPSPAELAEDEIYLAWIPKLRGHQHEGVGHRFDCPVCGKDRRLSVQAKPGRRHPEWNPVGCGCDRADVRAKLVALGLISGRYSPRHAADADDLIALALADMPPQSLRLGLLELAGMATNQALDKLGVTRTNRYRVVSALRQNRRS